MLLRLRVSLPDRPGGLGQVARALGALGADILQVTVLEREGGRAVDDFTVSWPGSATTEEVRDRLSAVPGVRVEWGNEHTAVQAFSYGETVFGCQYHPELSAADVHALIDLHADVITRWNGDVAAAHRSVDEHRDALAPDLFRRTVLPLIRG